MTRTIALIMAASIAAGSGVAMAAGAGPDRARLAGLDGLPPDVREYVMSRMGPEQRVDELVETTRLNQAAAGGFAGTEDVQRFNNAASDLPWHGDGDMTRSSDMYAPSVPAPETSR